MEDAKNFPTMIIPKGTEVTVNELGQLSIRTPGNLVIQNSGVYSVIESGAGSVRIDPEVEVEAVSVQAADSCFVAGKLTAWRVRAQKITLEKSAQANIMLQESETLELDRNARLVGNFASEKELYLMLGRFSRELRDLPNGLFVGQTGGGRIAAGQPAADDDGESFVAPDGEKEPGPAKRQEQSEVLSLVRVILEREIGRAGGKEAGREPLEKLLGLVRAGDLEELRENYLYLISQVKSPTEELERAATMLGKTLAAEKPSS
ncbi:MAG: hypothetical protein P8Y93_11820 [Acidobacteriota bacterium]